MFELDKNDPTTGNPWNPILLRHWADRLEVFREVSAWLTMLANIVELGE